MSGNILGLEQITDSAVGGKAYGLSRLLAMGLPVPPAFVIRGARAGSYPDDLEQRYRSLGGGKVAVRSSAQGEDGADVSFAGQYDTVLNVADSTRLRQAIDHCVASFTGARAARYREDQLDAAAAAQDAIPTNAGAMNLVVQCMVDARAAGVVFTGDPVSARRDLLIIDAVAGLGESLVSGEATPDHYAVDSAGVIVRRHLVGDNALLS